MDEELRRRAEAMLGGSYFHAGEDDLIRDLLQALESAEAIKKSALLFCNTTEAENAKLIAERDELKNRVALLGPVCCKISVPNDPMSNCNHTTCTCTECGATGSPGQLLQAARRHRDAAAQEQSRQAGKLGGRPRKNKEVPRAE